MALAATLLLVGCQTPASEPTRDTAALRVQLGKDLFFDPRLSADETISCASCHDVSAGGDDGRQTAQGIGDAIGPINTPTVLNSGLNFVQFWDGRAASLEDQVHGPITNPLEMGESWEPVLARLNADNDLVQRFQSIYNEQPDATNIADAIASYERALLTLNSPFDRYQAGDVNALTKEELSGYSQFENLGCSSCHQGVAFGGNMYQQFGVMVDYFELRGTPPTEADRGRYNVTGRREDMHRFKVPSLRNVALTAPYFHDGSAESLESAVRTMVRAQLGVPITDVQVTQLVAFLNALTGDVAEDLR